MGDHPEHWCLLFSVALFFAGQNGGAGWLVLLFHCFVSFLLQVCPLPAIPFCVSAHRDIPKCAMSGLQLVSWLANPMKDLTSVTFVGCGNSLIALSCSGSGLTPSLLITCPANFAPDVQLLSGDCNVVLAASVQHHFHSVAVRPY